MSLRTSRPTPSTATGACQGPAPAENRPPHACRKDTKFQFSRDRVIKEIKRRWNVFFAKGVRIAVDGRDVASFAPPLQGDEFKRTIPVIELGKKAWIEVSLLILREPSDLATVSITHRGQANFVISDVPIFSDHNAFTQGMLHGTVSGDVAALNASRTGFKEGEECDLWIERLLDLEEELGKIIEDRLRTAAEARNAAMLEEWMQHLKSVFSRTELATTDSSAGEGAEEGWEEEGSEDEHEREQGQEDSNRSRVDASSGTRGGKGKTGDRGRLPTVPYAGFTKARPNIRVVRERKAFRINVNHPDFVRASKVRGGSQKYIRELCMHEVYIYSLEGKQREWYIQRSDDFLGYWTSAFIGKGRKG